MKLSLIFLTLLQMHEITLLKDQTLIETACKNTPNYDLCVSTLHDSPNSAAAADVGGLGLILVDVVKFKAEAALSAVEELRPRHPEMRSALDQCLNSYKAVLLLDVPEAVAGLKKGVPKFAESGMTDAAWEAQICEGSFEMAAAATPLSGVNKEMHDLAQVAVGIIKILL